LRIRIFAWGGAVLTIGFVLLAPFQFMHLDAIPGRQAAAAGLGARHLLRVLLRLHGMGLREAAGARRAQTGPRLRTAQRAGAGRLRRHRPAVAGGVVHGDAVFLLVDLTAL
jgi:hypothetical protein